MTIKKAFEEYYGSLKPPEGMDLRVVLKLERSKRRRLLGVALLEAFLLFAILVLYLYQPIRGQEYNTFSAGVPVKLAKDVSLKRLSEDLKLHDITIHGPYEGDIFLLRGDEEKVKEFLKKSKNFRSLD